MPLPTKVPKRYCDVDGCGLRPGVRVTVQTPTGAPFAFDVCPDDAAEIERNDGDFVVLLDPEDGSPTLKGPTY